MKFKSLLTIGVFLVAYAFAYAQPANDDPCNAAVLSVGTTCNFQSFTNVNATASAGITSPTCGSYLGGDVWFTFDMPLSGQDVIIDLAENGGIINASMTVYSGPDCSNLTELICDDNSGISLMPQVTMDDGCTNSNGGVTYWVRVWENENDVAGTFDICTYKATPNAPIVGCGSFLPPSNTCCDAVITSLCEIDGYCSASANSYTVTPTENVPFCAVIENNSWISFVANSPDIELEFVVTNCAFNFGIQAQLFETTDCQNFTIASSCFNPGPGASLDGFLIANNLVPGNTYYLMVDGWASDNCDYTIYVKELSPEVEVTTIPSTICSGQTTQLNAEVFGTGNYTFSWTPTADLSDPTISNPVASPSVSTTYSVAITGLCEAVSTYSVDVTVDPGVPGNLMLSGQSIVCDNDLNQDYVLTGNNLVTNLWTVIGGSIVGPADSTTVNVNWNSAGGTICLDASNGCGAAPQECIAVTISPEPSISMASPVTGCNPPGFDLGTLTINDANNSVGIVTFYDNVGAANAGSPQLASDTVTTSGIYWVRKETAPSCFDVASVVVVLEEPDISVTNPAAVCAPNTVDLNSAFVSDANTLTGTKQFYPTQADAENLTNELTSTILSTGGTYWVRFTTSNGCFDIASITATIDETPDLSGMETSFCEGVGLDLATIPFTDANNTTLTSQLYFDDYTLALTGLPGFSLTNTVVQDTGYYYLRAATAAGCWDILELHTVFDQRPEGSLSGNADLCVGDSIDISFNLMGTAPFDVEYSDGTTTYNLTGISNGYVETIEVNSTTTFTLTSVSNGTCQGDINNGVVTANVSNSANASVSGASSICQGNATDILFTVDAVGLFDLILTDGTTLDTFANIADGFTYNVAPSTNTTYSVVEVIDNNYPSCDVNYAGSVALAVNTASDTTSVQFICNNTATQYQVVIDIEGGDPSSYVVNGDAGTLVGSQFTSAFINSNSPYSFVVTDANNCNPVTVAGTYECQCPTDAGEMVINAFDFCPGDWFIITHNNQQVLDANDAFGFVLHDSPTTTMGNIVASNTTGIFAFDPNTMIYGTTYYVSAVAANDDGTGFPVLDINLDPCLSLAAGNPVTFLRQSEAVLSGNQDLCSGNAATLTLSYDAPISIDIVISDGTTSDTHTNVSDGYTFQVSPTNTTTYTITSATTSDPTYCDIDVDGSALVNVNTATDTTSVQFICNNTATQYQVVIDIEGGDPSSYVVNGDAGTLVGSEFTSAFINSNSPYSFVVTDANNCNPVTVTGSHTCPCITDAGEMVINAFDFCPGDWFIITHNNQQVLDGDDAFGYVLHDSPTTTIGNVVAFNTTGIFAFDPSTMTYGTTYYVSAVAANDDGSGFPVLDINLDPCLSLAAGNPVTFLRQSEATLTGDASICNGDDATLTINYDAPINIDVVIYDGSNSSTYTNISDGYQFQVSPTNNTTYTITSAATSDPAYCDIDVDGSAVVNLHTAPDTSSVQFICNNTATQYQVVIDITDGDPSSYVVNGDPGTIVNGQFTSAFINSSAPYSFVVTDGNNCDPLTVAGSHVCPCISDAGEMVISAGEYCPGDVVSITHNNQQVLDGDDAFGYIMHDSPTTTIGNIVASNPTGAFVFDSNTMSYGTTYYISAIVGNDNGSGAPVQDIMLDACLSIAAGTPITFLIPSEATLTGGETLCDGESATLTVNYDGAINIDVVIFDGTDYNTIANIGDGYQFQVTPTGMTTYTISEALTTDPLYCDIDVAGSAIVDVNNAPDTTGVQFICSNIGTQYQVVIDITSGDPTSYVVNGGPGNIVGSQFTSAFIDSNTPYSFVVSDINNCSPITVAGTHECACITDAGAMVIDPAEYCDGDVVSITHNGQEVLDGNDAFGFVLHDSPTTTLGNILASNISGAFTFDPNTMSYGTTYYISAVAANDDGASMPVLDINLDPCLSVTLGTPITFLRSSTATLSGGETLCMGDTALLTVNYDAAINIDIVVFDGTNYDTISNISDGDQFEVMATMTTTYTLFEAITNDAAYCDIDVSGSAVVTTIARAIPDNVQVICDATNTQFQVVFNIIGGNAGGYTVSGDPGNLDLATSTFTSNWYPNNSTYSFTVADGQGCPPYDLVGTHFCECTTDAGSVGSSEEILCEGSPYLIYYNNDGTLDGDDVLGFVLHDGTATTIGTPIMTNLNGIFNYDPVLVYGQTYYVTAVVSNDDGTGFPNLDPNLDPCFSATDGLPITYYPSVMAGISAPDSICSNEPIPVTFHFDGTGLYNVEFFDGTSVITLENLLDGYVQSFEYTSDVQFYLESVSTVNCEGTLDPAATTVNVEVFETAEPIDINVTCLMDTAYIISFDIIGGDESTLFVTGDAGTLTGRTFVSEPITNNTPYSFTIDDGSICAPIDVVGIHNCMCDPNMAPFIDVNNQLTCTNQVNGAIEVMHPNNGGVPPYSYTWSSGASDKSLNDIGPGVYYVTIADANGCTVIDSIEFMAPDPIEAEIVSEMPSCPGEDDGAITFENISGGSGNYTIEIDGGFNLSDKQFVGFSSGSFMATITDDIGCSWEQAIMVEEPEPLLLDLGIDTLISVGDSVRLLPVTNGFVDTFMWSQDQLLPCPTCFSQVVYPFTSTVYQLTIVDPNGCQTTDDIIIRVDDERPVYIPNVFHPNGDGKNDMFTVFGGHVVDEVISMKIFDRWGEQVHSSGGYPPNDENYGWDGRFKGTMMNPNVYIYVVELRFTDGSIELYKGDISIIR